MTILSDQTIIEKMGKGEIKISPYPYTRAVQPASVDLKLATDLRRIDGTARNSRHIYPGEFFLGSTEETVTVPPDLVARVEGKSSLARMGILVHATAGFVDPGFTGRITLEFTNLSDRVFHLTDGMYICQISFEKLDRPAARPYGSEGLGSNYQGQTGTKESKYARTA